MMRLEIRLFPGMKAKVIASIDPGIHFKPVFAISSQQAFGRCFLFGFMMRGYKPTRRGLYSSPYYAVNELAAPGCEPVGLRTSSYSRNPDNPNIS